MRPKVDPRINISCLSVREVPNAFRQFAWLWQTSAINEDRNYRNFFPKGGLYLDANPICFICYPWLACLFFNSQPLGPNYSKENIRALKSVLYVVTIISPQRDAVDIHKDVAVAVMLFEPIKNSANYPLCVFSSVRDDDIWYRGPAKGT